MVILHIETSTSVCSAALSRDGQVLSERVNSDGQNHARMLPLFVQALLADAHAQGLTIDAVSLSQGPGSYTGLRIGTATAKGICYGLNIPLIAIDTLQGMVEGWMKQEIRNKKQETRLYVPMIDARRMEVYCGVYDAAGNRIREVEAKIIDEHAFADLLAEHTVYFFGDGSAKCKDVIQHPHAHFIDGIVPQARYHVRLAEAAYAQQAFSDVAYFDPFYLKEYQAVVSKPKGL